MRKTILAFGLAGTLIITANAFCAEQAEPDFSGTWVLDKEKTRNLPPQLKSYTMIVNQNPQQIAVETKLDDEFKARERGSGEGPPGGGFPGGSRRGGFPGGPGGGGFPGGASGRTPGADPRSGEMSLRMTLPSATYSLKGEETSAELEGMPGMATLKAEWEKGRTALKLSAARQVDFGGNAVTFTSKERWKLSEGGKFLELQRTVESPRGTDSITLIFSRERTDAAEEKLR
jgi:hypothetical protein